MLTNVDASILRRSSNPCEGISIDPEPGLIYCPYLIGSKTWMLHPDGYMDHTRKPGDEIIDHYCPDLSAEERELARAQLHALVRWQLKIVKREVQEMDPGKFDSSRGSMKN